MLLGDGDRGLECEAAGRNGERDATDHADLGVALPSLSVVPVKKTSPVPEALATLGPGAIRQPLGGSQSPTGSAYWETAPVLMLSSPTEPLPAASRNQRLPSGPIVIDTTLPRPLAAVPLYSPAELNARICVFAPPTDAAPPAT